MRTGRPTSFRPEYAEQAHKLCLLGATDADLASFFGVSVVTVGNWKLNHPSFLGALKAGKAAADAHVAERLYKRATGYEHDAVKIMLVDGQPAHVPYVERYPPDTTACIFWLKNRRPDAWRDRVQQEHSGSVAVQQQTIDRPPAETREQWIARRQRELAAQRRSLATAEPAGSAD